MIIILNQEKFIDGENKYLINTVIDPCKNWENSKMAQSRIILLHLFPIQKSTRPFGTNVETILERVFDFNLFLSKLVIFCIRWTL